jgi:hypothetical protein
MPQTVVARLRPSAFRKIPWRRLCCGLSRTEILREQSNPNAQASIKCDLIGFFILGTRLNVLAGVVGFGRTGGCNRAANLQFYPDLFGEVLLVFEFFESFDDVFASVRMSDLVRRQLSSASFAPWTSLSGSIGTHPRGLNLLAARAWHWLPGSGSYPQSLAIAGDIPGRSSQARRPPL